MVQFQEDNDDLTTGNGKFQLQNVAVPMIDPPPHDSVYFWNKLRFVKDYFEKTSKGILTVSGDVYGQAYPIILSKPMSAYSPPIEGSNHKKLAELAIESWHIADSLYPEIDFSKYDVFTIFHAGVGRYIDFVSAIGYNPTPYDIPSLYLDSTAFATAIDSFTGISVDGNSVQITNSIILPETESRVISTVNGNDTLQYSINGLFAASIGSFLGLPDLFNTKTGRSGIGQFGLMDGASMFAFNGLFPPAPCAWERITLGWIEPIDVTSSTSNLSIPAIGFSNFYQDTIYKIPITHSEYFLVENRNRDPDGNGQTLRMVQNGNETTQYFRTDTPGFTFYDARSINGSVIGVENYDWAIIGEADSTGKYDGGGILIWHIDENAIQSRLSTNSINADQSYRGVDLEEADGSKDIGYDYEFMTAGYGSENGSPLDCWFSGNSSPLYKNIFNKNSIPNSNSNSGSASLVTLKDFSPRAPRMTFTIEIGNSSVKRLITFMENFKSSDTVSVTSSSSGIFLTSGTNIYAYDRSGQSKKIDTTGLFSIVGGKDGIAVHEVSATQSVLIGTQDSTVYIWEVTDNDNNGTYDNIQASQVRVGQRVYGPCMITSLGLIPSVLVHGDGIDNRIWQIGLDGTIQNTRVVDSYQMPTFTQLPTPSLSKPFEYFSIGNQSIISEQVVVSLPIYSQNWILAGAVSADGNYIAAFARTEERLCAYAQDLSQQLFDIHLPGSLNAEIAIGDINGDGSKDIALLSSKKLNAVNRGGVILDGFPINAPLDSRFMGVPLITDFDADGSIEILCMTEDGRLWIYNSLGKLIDGYPLLVGSSGSKVVALFKSSSNKLGYIVLSGHGNVDAIEFQIPYDSQKIIWSQQMGNGEHINSDPTVVTIQLPSQEFLPKSRVYNWPNPVYGELTHIRFYSSEDAEVKVSIVDLS